MRNIGAALGEPVDPRRTVGLKDHLAESAAAERETQPDGDGATERAPAADRLDRSVGPVAHQGCRVCRYETGDLGADRLEDVAMWLALRHQGGHAPQRGL